MQTRFVPVLTAVCLVTSTIPLAGQEATPFEASTLSQRAAIARAVASPPAQTGGPLKRTFVHADFMTLAVTNATGSSRGLPERTARQDVRNVSATGKHSSHNQLAGVLIAGGILGTVTAAKAMTNNEGQTSQGRVPVFVISGGLITAGIVLLFRQ